jgi:hypothetical protein
MSNFRVGFCCKWINNASEVAGLKPSAVDRELNGRSTTMRWLREHPAEAEQRQWDIMNHNARAALLLVERVGNTAQKSTHGTTRFGNAARIHTRRMDSILAAA